MRGVKPLVQKELRHQEQPKRLKEPKAKPLKPLENECNNTRFLSDYVAEEVQSESLLSYRVNSIAHQRFKALKQGKIPWQAKLDLHGCYADDAREKLVAFITAKVQAGLKCVLIIHGKGGHQGQPPVIKNRVNRWLTQFPEVLAFHSALPQDGGAGAVYVLLKQNLL